MRTVHAGALALRTKPPRAGRGIACGYLSGVSQTYILLGTAVACAKEKEAVPRSKFLDVLQNLV